MSASKPSHLAQTPGSRCVNYNGIEGPIWKLVNPTNGPSNHPDRAYRQNIITHEPGYIGSELELSSKSHHQGASETINSLCVYIVSNHEGCSGQNPYSNALRRQNSRQNSANRFFLFCTIASIGMSARTIPNLP